ncbi:YihY/virulence factor BrkB family protein [Ilyomonas limi]|uniref:YihY/virulence factor BrkB family protein n=1 Tax=Ilyomonas limi TaxID=2575867 RepID=A0A4U3L402_9BACT|nr:YihY/virulence factor BrkB family protein [Ilyomonas limi]TKK69828.1 YihY/virulence factor BrkB family protein [Ilyomonas limi]
MALKLKLKNIWTALKKSGSDIGTYNITKLSAALAYYTVFALAPMLIVLTSVISFFYGREATEGQVYGQIKTLVGAEAAAQIQQIIKNAALSPSFTFASIVGLVALVFSATGVFAEIQTSINIIWNLKTKPKRSGILKMLKTRLLSFSLIVSLGFIALVSLLINALIGLLMDRLQRFLPPEAVHLGFIINVVITLLAIGFLFAIVFKVLPDAKIKWRDVWVGAFATAVLFMIGRFGIGLYLNKSDPGSTFGAAGSMILILLWVYYSSIILYFGAAFTRNYAQTIGRHIYPNEYAVYIQQVEVESKDSLQNINTGKQVQEADTNVTTEPAPANKIPR